MNFFLTIVFFFLAPLGAQDFAGMDLKASLKAATENGINLIEKRPLLEMLAERDKSSLKLDLGGEFFYVTYSFDADWEVWFSIKPEQPHWGNRCRKLYERPEKGLGAGAWKEIDLKKGVFYDHGRTKLFIKEIDGAIGIMFSIKDLVEVKKDDLFSALYEKSSKIAFGDAVTYAVFRNLSPLTEQEGTVTLRIGSDGLFYYSLTQDNEIAASPRWLLAVNGILYGLRLDDADLSFVSKKINLEKPAFLAPEKAFNAESLRETCPELE